MLQGLSTPAGPQLGLRGQPRECMQHESTGCDIEPGLMAQSCMLSV